MEKDVLLNPLSWMNSHGFASEHTIACQDYDAWWQAKGLDMSRSVDRAGTPWLRNFDVTGERVDELLFTCEYWSMLRQGYSAGVLWRAFETDSAMPFFELGYIASFYDPGLYCPYTVSMASALAIAKLGSPELKYKFLQPLLARNGDNWQGATWMTERAGGSDLGAAVETHASRTPSGWLLSGEKYFCSNLGAELAIVAARPVDAPDGVRGLALFLVPKRRADGSLNYLARRLKDKIATRSVPTGEVELKDAEAFLLSDAGPGIYAILDVLNLSRVANAIAATALVQRALADTLVFARRRVAFGKPIIEHPLIAAQCEYWTERLADLTRLSFETAKLFEETRREQLPFSDRHALFRLFAHIAKFWTAEQAVQCAKWSMEVHGGVGVLVEFGAERHLREAMILAIWEGAPQRHCLDALEVIQRKSAHVLLFAELADCVDSAETTSVRQWLESVLAEDQASQERKSEMLMRTLADYVCKALRRRFNCSAISP